MMTTQIDTTSKCTRGGWPLRPLPLYPQHPPKTNGASSAVRCQKPTTAAQSRPVPRAEMAVAHLRTASETLMDAGISPSSLKVSAILCCSATT
jgi:hypothetical protein